METNRAAVAIINIHRLRIEMKHHHSPIFSADTNFGLSFRDILQILGHIAPYADDRDMVAEMSYDIADSLEMNGSDDYQALVGLINDSARFLINDLSRAIRLYPGREAYFSELIGDCAHFVLE